jgi:hypothetical protein
MGYCAGDKLADVILDAHIGTDVEARDRTHAVLKAIAARML